MHAATTTPDVQCNILNYTKAGAERIKWIVLRVSAGLQEDSSKTHHLLSFDTSMFTVDV